MCVNRGIKIGSLPMLCRSASEKSLKILSFNVENLRPKLDDPQFLSLMEEHDLCLFTETWLPNDDKIGLPSFWDFHFTRVKKSKHGRYSGGISAFVKKNLKNGVKVISMKEGFLWLKIEKDVFALNNHLFLCVAYIPPQYSKSFCSINVDYFKELSQSIAKFSNEGDIMLTGDFNSRLGCPVEMCHECFEDLDRFLPPTSTVFTDVPPRATSVQNQYGKNLIKVCQSFNLYVANGRTPGDRLGNFTCYTSRGPSMVDLIIGDHCSIKSIKRLHVLPPTFNSVHCPLSFVISCGTSKSLAVKKLEPRPAKVKWNTDKEEVFIRTVQKADWGNLEKLLSDDSTDSVELVAEGVSKYLTEAATSCMPIINNRSKGKSGRVKHKPWFNKDIQYLKKRLNNLARLITKFPKNPIIRGNLVSVKKLYRKSMKDAKYQFEQNAVEKLTDLANNPKEFWSYVNKLMGRDKSRDCAVSDNAWIEHFTTLNSKDPSLSSSDDPNVKKIKHFINSTIKSFDKKVIELDQPFLPNEILKGINRLKHHKSGSDSVCNEMIKAAKYSVSPGGNLNPGMTGMCG